jgi:hypothetical protein
VGWVFEVSDLFFVLSDSVGDGLNGGTEMSDFGGESGEGSRVVSVMAVFFDNGTQGLVAVKGGAADSGVVGNSGKGDSLFVSEELDAGGFDPGEVVVGHLVAWAMR